MTPALFLAVVVAGAAGALGRAFISQAVLRRWARRGAGTLVVNLSGAFALGLWTGAGLSVEWVQVVGTGFLGAFTTFSTWMVESLHAWHEGRRLEVVCEVSFTLAVGVLLALLGGQVARTLS